MSLQLYFAKRCRSSIIAEAEDLGAAAGANRHAYQKAAVVIIVYYNAVGVFQRPYAVIVVCKVDILSGFAPILELFACPSHGRTEVARRIAHFII